MNWYNSKDGDGTRGHRTITNYDQMQNTNKTTNRMQNPYKKVEIKENHGENTSSDRERRNSIFGQNSFTDMIKGRLEARK